MKTPYLRQRIAAHTGLQIRQEETDKLYQTIHSRMAEYQRIDPEAYCQFLAIDTAVMSGKH
jgi:hypothetical protein